MADLYPPGPGDPGYEAWIESKAGASPGGAMEKRLHPAFREAMRIRGGVNSMTEDDKPLAMVTIADDWDGKIAEGLVTLYHSHSHMDGLVVAFLAGMIRERDR